MYYVYILGTRNFFIFMTIYIYLIYYSKSLIHLNNYCYISLMDFKCNICNKLYKSYQSLWNHNHKFHNNLKLNISNGIQNNSIPNNTKEPINTTTNNDNCVCQFCNKKLSTRQSRWRHEKTCRNAKKQNIDNNIVITDSTIQNIINNKITEIIASSKHTQFLNKNKSPKTNNTTTVTNKDKKFKCSHCIESFDTTNELDNHYKTKCKPSIGYNNIYLFDTNTFGANKYPKGGDIYIIQTDFEVNNFYKIGISNDLPKRLKTHKCGIVHEPRVHAYFSIKNIKEADVILKQKLKKYNIKREIYQCEDLNEIKQIIKSIQSEFDSEQVEIVPTIKQCDICECKYCNEIFPCKYELDTHNTTCLAYVIESNLTQQLQPEKQNKNQLRKLLNEQFVNCISSFDKTDEHFNRLLNRIHCIEQILSHSKFPNTWNDNYIVNIWNKLIKNNSISNEKLVEQIVTFINKNKTNEIHIEV